MYLATLFAAQRAVCLVVAGTFWSIRNYSQGVCPLATANKLKSYGRHFRSKRVEKAVVSQATRRGGKRFRDDCPWLLHNALHCYDHELSFHGLTPNAKYNTNSVRLIDMNRRVVWLLRRRNDLVSSCKIELNSETCGSKYFLLKQY